MVDPPHKIWTILRAWTPSPGCLQLLGYLEREQFDIDYMDCTLNEDPWRDLFVINIEKDGGIKGPAL